MSSASRIAELLDGRDRTREVAPEALRQSSLRLTNRVEDLAAASFFIVTVPTPIDDGRRPDLAPMRSAPAR